MITAVDRLIVNLEVALKGLEQLDKVNQRMAMLEKAQLKYNKAGRWIDANTKRYVTQQEALNRIKKVQSQVATKGRGMNMAMFGLGMSLLFTGMALKRFAETALRSLVNNFMTLADESSAALKQILHVQAAFQYLQFVIMDTLGKSELFQSFVTWLVQAAINIARFVETNPRMATLLGIFLLISVVLGTISMTMGQLYLLSIGLQIGFLPLLAIILLIGLGVSALFMVFTSDAPPAIKLLQAIIVLVAIIATIAAIAGLAISLPLLAILALGALIVVSFAMMAAKVGGLGNAFKAFGIFVLAIFAAIGDAFIEMIILPLRAIIALINMAIRASNRFLGTNISTINQPEAFTLSKRVWEMRNSLIAEGQGTSVEEDKKVEEKQTNNLLTQILDALQTNGISINPSTDT